LNPVESDAVFTERLSEADVPAGFLANTGSLSPAAAGTNCTTHGELLLLCHILFGAKRKTAAFPRFDAFCAQRAVTRSDMRETRPIANCKCLSDPEDTRSVL
jgi:hypothetical protein